MKKTTKPAAKAAAKPATKRPRTYKKADLPRTARAYLGKVYEVHMGKENEAVARLIELHEERTKALQVVREELYKKVQAEREADYARNIYPLPAAEPAFVFAPESRKLTLREKFLAWIGAR
jgi:hypothetical protein